jgi:MFS family permease
MQREKALQHDNRTARLAMVAACCAVFLTALDQTVVVTALPRIITDLSITVQQLDRAAWIVSGYLLGYIIAMPLMGRVSDMYGRRSVFLLCLGIFAAGSFLCARSLDLGNSLDISFLQHIGLNVASPDNIGAAGTISPGLAWLVAARFIQAVGGGALIPVAMAIAGDFYGEQQRSLALGLIGMVMETGGVLGPLYGALILQSLGWQAIFYLNLPIVAILVVLTWLFIPSRNTSRDAGVASAPAASGKNHRSRIDLAGTLLLGAALACLSLGLSQEAVTSTSGVAIDPNASPIQNNPWLIGASLLLLAIFVLLEWWLARRAQGTRGIIPIIELEVFRQIPFAAASLVSLLVGGALIIAMVDIPFFIDTVVGGSALDSGLALLRLTAMIPVGALLGGYLCPRITCRLTAALGLLLASLGFFLMHLWPLNVNWLQITASTLIGGLGFGIVIAPIGTTAINAVRSTQMGMASSIITVLRMAGMIIGLAALTAWGLGRFHSLMLAFNPPAGATPLSPAYTTALAQYATAAGHDVYTSIFLAAGIITFVAVVPALLFEGKQSSPYALSRHKGVSVLKRRAE